MRLSVELTKAISIHTLRVEGDYEKQDIRRIC